MSRKAALVLLTVALATYLLFANGNGESIEITVDDGDSGPAN